MWSRGRRLVRHWLGICNYDGATQLVSVTGESADPGVGQVGAGRLPKPLNPFLNHPPAKSCIRRQLYQAAVTVNRGAP